MSKLFPYLIAAIAIGLAVFQTLRLNSINDQYALLAEGEDAFIQAEYETAFECYAQVDLPEVNDEFLGLRKNLAELKDYSDDAEEAKLLTENLVELIKNCSGISGASFNLHDKSLAELAALLKECYIDAKGIKEEKIKLVEQLSKVDYLKFTNYRGNSIHYLGPVVDSMATGEGVGIWENESFYRGAWLQNNREGSGYFRTSKGEVYEGEYSNDRRNGKGTYLSALPGSLPTRSARLTSPASG